MARYCQRTDDGYLYPYSEALAARGDIRVVNVDPRNVVAGFVKKEEVQPAAPTEEAPEPESEEPPSSPIPETKTEFQSMTKRDLEAYARREHGAELDRRLKQATLAKQVSAMESGMSPQEALAIEG